MYTNKTFLTISPYFFISITYFFPEYLNFNFSILVIFIKSQTVKFWTYYYF